MGGTRLRTTLVVTTGLLLMGGLVALPAEAVPSGAATPSATPPAPPPLPPSPYQVVASGLNNPRHLSVSPSGALYVAESGTGGTGPCIISSEGGQVCYGPTGAITEITRHHKKWTQRRVVTGLPSLAPPADLPASGDNPPVTKGASATGPSGVVVMRHHRYVISVGLGAPPSARKKGHATTSPTSTVPATLPKGFGTLLTNSLLGRHGHRFSLKPHRTWRVLADLARHEARTNPVDDRDSNPASVVRAGSHFLVADAGGNTVLKVSARGRIRTIAAFKDTMVPGPGGSPMPMQFVPTAVVPGPRHSYFVSQLTGFPFPPGGAAIWKVRPGHAPKVYASGLTNVTDLAFGRDGSLYVVEISAAGLTSGPPIGALVRIPRGGGAAQVVAGGLFAPYGVALLGNSAYVTTGSILPGGGQVIKVPLHH